MCCVKCKQNSITLLLVWAFNRGKHAPGVLCNTHAPAHEAARSSPSSQAKTGPLDAALRQTASRTVIYSSGISIVPSSMPSITSCGGILSTVQPTLWHVPRISFTVLARVRPNDL